MALEDDILKLLKSEGYRINEAVRDAIDEFIEMVEDEQDGAEDDEDEEEEDDED